MQVRQSICIVAMVMVIGFISVPVFGQNQAAEKKKQAASSSEVKTDARDETKTAGSYTHQKKEQYQKKAEEKLHRFEGQLKRLYARAEKKSNKAKEKISRATDDLKKKSESAKNKLKDLKESGEEKWEKARNELDSMLKDLEHTYNRTVAKFKD